MVRFTQPGDFNDPFEFRPYIQYAASDEVLREYAESNFGELIDQQLAQYGTILPPDVLQELLNTSVLEVFRDLEVHLLEGLAPSIDATFNQKVGVICLSEVPDSILMWGHYTDHHRGFVVGFDSEHSFFSKRRSQEDEFGFLRPVNYQRERPRVVLSDTSSPVWFSTKSDQWAYEREWRMLRSLSEADSRIESTRFPVCLFGFPEDAVMEIIIGLRSTPTLAQRIEALARTFPKATLLRAIENPMEYSLVLTKV
jgi:hypothetical protein